MQTIMILANIYLAWSECNETMTTPNTSPIPFIKINVEKRPKKSIGPDPRLEGSPSNSTSVDFTLGWFVSVFQSGQLRLTEQLFAFLEWEIKIDKKMK